MNSITFWQVFTLAMAAIAPLAEASECKTFVHESNPAVTVTDDVKTITVRDGEDTSTYDVVIDKYFGQLMSAAYGPDGLALPYRYLDLDGKRVLILQSAVFYPTCK